MIYFDYNATTPIDDRVIDVMLPYLQIFFGNPSSLYRMGRVVRSAIDTAREQVAALVNVHPAQIIFTSGGTEANNLALNTKSKGSNIAISAVEHLSITERANQDMLGDVFVIPVDNNGLFLSVESLPIQQPKSHALASIMLANNENGVIQNVKRATQLLKEKNFLVHTDAVQAVGKIPVSFNELNVHLMSLSSHKIYGPKGCGALVIDKQVGVNPIIMGGGQESDWRSGTENVAAIIGFGKAAELALTEFEQRSTDLLKLRCFLEKELKTIPGLVIFSEQVERLPNTVQFGIKGIDGEMLQMQLDQKNIAVSSGSACSSGGGKASSVLTAMGIENTLAKSAIRISLGKMNTIVEIKEFITTLKSLVITD